MSLDNGPEDIAVTGGYYQIGLVFEKLHKEEKAMSFFAKCVQLWRHFFKKKEQFDTSRAAEAIQMLEYIHSYRLKKNESGVLAAETVFVLAQVYNVLGNIEKAHELAKTCTEGSSY
jgi:tetratricopeptide (TPR) repeat protein